MKNINVLACVYLTPVIATLTIKCPDHNSMGTSGAAMPHPSHFQGLISCHQQEPMDWVCVGGLAGRKLEEFLIEEVWMINEAAITRKRRISFRSQRVVMRLNIKTIGRDLVIVNSAR